MGTLFRPKREKLELILRDLRLLSEKSEIKIESISDLASQLESDEVKSYLRNLEEGSKPETALREAFFAGHSVLSSYLSDEVRPEISLGEDGWIDYQIGLGTRSILLELKSLFEPEIRHSKSGNEIVSLKQGTLKWEDHKDQILKYIQGREYVVLTNLQEWAFFNKTVNPDDCQPFHKLDLFEFVKDFDVIGDPPEFIKLNNEVANKSVNNIPTTADEMKQLVATSLGSGWIKLHPESLDIPENITLLQSKPGLTPETMNNQKNAAFAWTATNWSGACDELAKIAKPTLVITGTDDNYYVPHGNALILAGKIPGAWLVQIKDAGHAIMDQYPAEVSEILNTFLSTVPNN